MPSQLVPYRILRTDKLWPFQRQSALHIMATLIFRTLLAFGWGFGKILSAGDNLFDSRVSTCTGYDAFNVILSNSGLTASLHLAGAPCNTYGDDLMNLTLSVTYETGKLWPNYRRKGSELYCRKQNPREDCRLGGERLSDSRQCFPSTNFPRYRIWEFQHTFQIHHVSVLILHYSCQERRGSLWYFSSKHYFRISIC